jgi:hypothetical protein
MDSYTFKAILIIALFGLFEAALNFPRVRKLGRWLKSEAGELSHWLATAPRALQPVKAKAKRRRH